MTRVFLVSSVALFLVGVSFVPGQASVSQIIGEMIVAETGALVGGSMGFYLLIQMEDVLELRCYVWFLPGLDCWQAWISWNLSRGLGATGLLFLMDTRNGNIPAVLTATGMWAVSSTALLYAASHFESQYPVLDWAAIASVLPFVPAVIAVIAYRVGHPPQGQD